jgi:hypothetical protein
MRRNGRAERWTGVGTGGSSADVSTVIAAGYTLHTESVIAGSTKGNEDNWHMTTWNIEIKSEKSGHQNNRRHLRGCAPWKTLAIFVVGVGS